MPGLPEGYAIWLTELKNRVAGAQHRAARALNHELVLLYWDIGHAISERQREAGWGSKIVDRLSQDLCAAFPDMRGFSPRNLKYMRAFHQAWPDREIVQQAAAQLPWGHNQLLLDKLDCHTQRQWYARKAMEHAWSRNTLSHHLESGLINRSGAAITNFEARLPEPHAALAVETLKDPYLFDFLNLGEAAQERDIEQALVKHVTDFLLELGAGFAFVGRQYLLKVGDEEFFVDLLFYHLKLRCYVVIELKAGKFKPEHLGQLGFYLTAIDRQVRTEHDAPTLGLLLCKSKDEVVAEYALADKSQPMGIAEYKLLEALPTELQGGLPTIEQIERELRGAPGEPPPAQPH